MSHARDVQGRDPKHEVFKGLAAVVYAAEATISAGYIEQSRMLAMAADMAAGGLRGKFVLDVGSGYGTTTFALVRHAPARIVSVDSSEAHIELLNTITGGDSIEEYLVKKGAPEVLGEFYEPTLRYFQRVRRDYATSLFRKIGSEIQTQVASTLDLPAHLQAEGADVAVGNNWLHWPVNQRRSALEKTLPADEAFTKAFADAVDPMYRALRKGGTFAILEPADFSYDDTDEKLTALLEGQGMTEHPVYILLQKEINDILKKEHGIDRPMPKTARLFPKSKMAGLFAQSGFMLETVTTFEGTFPCDPVAAFYVRTPMWLGGVNLPFDVKMRIAKRGVEITRATLSEEQLNHPVRGEYTIYVSRRT